MPDHGSSVVHVVSSKHLLLLMVVKVLLQLLFVHLYDLAIIVFFCLFVLVSVLSLELLLIQAHEHLLLLHLLLQVHLIVVLLLVLLLLHLLLIDLCDVGSIASLSHLVVCLIFVAHVFLVLVLLNRLSDVMIRGVLSFFLIFSLVHAFLLLLLLLLLELLLHHKHVLLLLERHVLSLVAWEVGGCKIQAVVVLCTQQEFLLLVSQVGIRVHIGLTQNVHVLLQLADLREVSHESLGHLLHQKRFVSHIEVNGFFLFLPDFLKLLALLLGHFEALSLPFLEFLSSADQSR